MSIGRVPGVTGIQPSIVDAKGDLIVATAADSVDRLAVGTNEQRLVADSATATGLKYVADTTNYAIAAKGDLLVGTAADTLAALTVGSANQILTVDSSTATGLKWAAAPTSDINWTLLNAGGTALTGATTVTVSGISNKNMIMVLISEASSANANSTISFQINSDTGNNYHQYGAVQTGASTYAATNTGSQSNTSTDRIRAGDGGTDAGYVCSGGLMITGANTSGVKAYQLLAGVSLGAGANTNRNRFSMGYWSGSGTITSISVVSNSGNLDNGTVWVYGA